jgi:hypothetical protein
MNREGQSGAGHQSTKTWVALLSSIIGASAVVWAAVISVDAKHNLEAKDAEIREIRKQLQVEVPFKEIQGRAEQEVESLKAALVGKEAEVRTLRSTVAQLESRLNGAVPESSPATGPTIVQEFAFSMERCVREGGDVNCWVRVTNSGSERTLKVMSDGSWLRDQDDNTREMSRSLKANGDRELNILRIDLPNQSAARFGVHYAGAGGSVKSIKFLRVHAVGFNIDFDFGPNGVEVK